MWTISPNGLRQFCKGTRIINKDIARTKGFFMGMLEHIKERTRNTLSRLQVLWDDLLVSPLFWIFVAIFMFVLYCVISCNETEKKEQKKDEIAIENWERQRQQDSINDLYTEHNNIEYKETVLHTGDAPYGKGVAPKGALSSCIISNPTRYDAVVILVNQKGKWVRNSYIPSGASYKMKNIPEGKYIIKVTQGYSWYNQKDNGEGKAKGGFMKDVSYYESKWDECINFTYKRTKDGISYQDHEIKLIANDGNKQISRVTPKDFFK